MAETSKEPVDNEKPDADDDVDGFLKQARKRFDRAMEAEAINRQMAVEDLKFKNGDQWPEQIRATRTIEKRPCLTINKMKTFVHQITNDQRQNRPAINVSPIGDRSDPDTANMLKGLIRQIERQSNADVAYDTAFDSAVTNGWGYWRIITEYESDDSFNQVIRVKRIRNPFRVYMDPDRQEPDGSDAKWCFISDLIPREEFKAQWPKADPCDWDEQSMGVEEKNWVTDTHIRIAEYFCFETENKTLLAFADGSTGYKEDLPPEVLEAINLQPELVVNEREVEAKHIEWYKITAKEILEETDWVGKWIPIVECVGDEIDIEGKVTKAGLVRDAKDPQRMYNFWSTSETEMIALAPKAPWVMEEGQVEGHEQRWKEANNKSFPYLLYKGTSIAGKPAPAPQRQAFAGPPAAIVNAKAGAAQDMMAVTGIRFDSTLAERSYDESGRALRELKRVSDIGSFHYVDNLARSLRHTGRILIDLIPKIYDTSRVLTILREDGSEEQVGINPQLQKPGQAEINGKVMKLYNPKLGDYDVAVTIGPSFATKRAEAADSMLGFMQAVPQAGPMIGDLIAKNMDWPGADEIAERLASSLPPHLLQKNASNLPPEARAIIGSMQQQLQGMSQQLQQAVGMLGDKEQDRNIEREKLDIERAKLQVSRKRDEETFEAALTKIAADMQAQFVGMAEAQMQRIAETVTQMEAKFQAPLPAPETAPAAPMAPINLTVQMPRAGKKRITAPDGRTFVSEDVEDEAA